MNDTSNIPHACHDGNNNNNNHLHDIGNGNIDTNNNNNITERPASAVSIGILRESRQRSDSFRPSRTTVPSSLLWLSSSSSQQRQPQREQHNRQGIHSRSNPRSHYSYSNEERNGRHRCHQQPLLEILEDDFWMPYSSSVPSEHHPQQHHNIDSSRLVPSRQNHLGSEHSRLGERRTTLDRNDMIRHDPNLWRQQEQEQQEGQEAIGASQLFGFEHHELSSSSLSSRWFPSLGTRYDRLMRPTTRLSTTTTTTTSSGSGIGVQRRPSLSSSSSTRHYPSQLHRNHVVVHRRRRRPSIVFRSRREARQLARTFMVASQQGRRVAAAGAAAVAPNARQHQQQRPPPPPPPEQGRRQHRRVVSFDDDIHFPTTTIMSNDDGIGGPSSSVTNTRNTDSRSSRVTIITGPSRRLRRPLLRRNGFVAHWPSAPTVHSRWNRRSSSMEEGSTATARPMRVESLGGGVATTRMNHGTYHYDENQGQNALDSSTAASLMPSHDFLSTTTTRSTTALQRHEEEEEVETTTSHPRRQQQQQQQQETGRALSLPRLTSAEVAQRPQEDDASSTNKKNGQDHL